MKIKKKPVVHYFLATLFCLAAGMGVPIFNICLGFLVGWWWGSSLRQIKNESLRLLILIKMAFLTASVTMVLMAIIWLPTLRLYFDPTFDLANFGIPLILYEPELSYLGWLALMVVVSPFLQVLMTVFGGVLRLVRER